MMFERNTCNLCNMFIAYISDSIRACKVKISVYIHDILDMSLLCMIFAYTRLCGSLDFLCTVMARQADHV